ncbi:MAG: polysaccharide biosynthesis C-terminal domain-containing protein [Oscillospiraceae bacterium]|nr:polysaccharide biosynthesis C-terminal domain-containing protein [Oscillospiraceae bacterium]
MSKQKQQSLVNGAIVLTFAMLAVKVIGILFKMPLTDTIGMLGRGYFDLVYQIYTPIFAISVAGLPIAVARMISESIALKRYRDARAILQASRRIFLIAGLLGTAVLVLIAYPYIMITKAPSEILPGIFMVAPAIFFCCMMSSYRGYYEGLRNMNPTAASQFIEAAGKLVVGLFLAKQVLSYGMGIYESSKAADGTAVIWGTTVHDSGEAYTAIVPWAAAGAVLGVTVGSVLGLIYLMARHKLRGDGLTRLDLELSPEAKDRRAISKELLKIALPVVIGALILNVSNLIDTMTIVGRTTTALGTDFSTVWAMHKDALDSAVANDNLRLTGNAQESNQLIATYLFGAYNTGVDFRNLVPTITSGFGISVLPVLAAAWATRNRDEVRRSIDSIMRLCLLIALPAGFGMAVLAKPMLTILYGSGNAADGISVAVPVLQIYGVVTALLALSTPITNMLQGLGRTDIPVKTMAFCIVLKIVCNLVFIGIPSLNIYGSMIGTIIFYVFDVGINLFMLGRITGVRVAWWSVLVKPLFCAILCAASAWAGYGLLLRGVESVLPGLTDAAFFQSAFGAKIVDHLPTANTLAALLSVLIAVIIYVVSLLLTKAITKDDVIGLPKGEKIAKALAKHRLLG